MWCPNCQCYKCKCSDDTLSIGYRSCGCMVHPCNCPGHGKCKLCLISTLSSDILATIQNYNIIWRNISHRSDLQEYLSAKLCMKICSLKVLMTGCSDHQPQKLQHLIEAFYNQEIDLLAISIVPDVLYGIITRNHHLIMVFPAYIGCDNGIYRVAAEEAPAVKKIGWKKFPKGWTMKSFKSFWSKITKEDPDHPFTACVNRMKDRMANPERFCASILDTFFGTTGWRNKGTRIDLEKKLGIYNPDAGPAKNPLPSKKKTKL